MDKNIFPKIIFPLLVFTLLFFFFVLVYNHNKETKAQEVGLVCDEEEIPIGEALEEARKLASAITGNSQAMFNSALSQIEAAKDLLTLADQCSSDNCNTDCNRWCIDADGDGICSDDEWNCEISDCSGNPCPPEIVGKALTIGLAYLQIENSKKAIEDVIANRDEILDKLKEAREELEKCVTPAGELTEAEAREARTLIPCHEIKLQGALPGDKEDCDNPNNFYCCQFE